MFDIGFWELILIAIIALLVVGPERMPALVKKAGIYAGKIKRFFTQAQDELNNHIQNSQINEIKEHLSIEDEKHSILEIVKDTQNIDKK